MEIDLVPIKDLWTQYGVGRTTFYTRALTDLRIEPQTIGTRSYITGEQKALLDKYYKLPESSRSDWLDELFGRIELEENAIAPVSSTAMMVEFVKALHPQRERIASFKDLAYLAAIEEMVPTSLVRELTGTTPKGDTYQWGRFEFTRCGRMGREIAWVVRRVSSSKHLLKTNTSSGLD